MKNLHTILLIICAIGTSAQTDKMIVSVPKKNKYIHQQEFYSFDELKPFFNGFSDTREFYVKKYRPVKDRSILLSGLTGFCVILIVASPPTVPDPDVDLNISTGDFLGVLFGVSFGMASVNSFIKLSKRKSTLIKMYNDHFEYRGSYYEPKVDLKLRYSRYGMGLVLNF